MFHKTSFHPGLSLLLKFSDCNATSWRLESQNKYKKDLKNNTTSFAEFLNCVLICQSLWLPIFHLGFDAEEAQKLNRGR
jgi:uncharacterized damage-inducible protein DinB